MKRCDLIREMSERTGLTQKKMDEVLTIIFEGAKDALRQGDDVYFACFLTLYVGERAARRSRNPYSGESIYVPAKKVLRCKFSDLFKKEIRES